MALFESSKLLKVYWIQIKPFVICPCENHIFLDGLIRKLHDVTAFSHIFDSPDPTRQLENLRSGSTIRGADNCTPGQSKPLTHLSQERVK